MGLFSGVHSLAALIGIPPLYVYAVSGTALCFSAMQILEKKRKGAKLASDTLGTLSDYRSLTGNDGVVLAKGMQLNRTQSNEGVLVVGPTGSRKTTSVILPSLHTLLQYENVLLVTDPKGELYHRLSPALEHAPHEVYRFHLHDPTHSNRYDPLSYCTNETDVLELSENIILNGSRSMEQKTGSKRNDSEWMDMATPLLSAFLLLLWSRQFQHVYTPSGEIDPRVSVPNTIPRLFEFLLSAPEDVLFHTIQRNHYEPAILQYTIYLQSKEAAETTASIRTVLANGLKKFMTDPHLQHILSGNDLDPTTIRQTPKIIFLQYPFEKGDYYAPFTSVFFRQLMDALMRQSGHQTFFLVDELANIGTIPGFSNFVTTCRYQQISFTGVIQSISQLEDKYGRKGTQTILGNLKTKVFFPGLDLEDVTYVSKLCGQKQIERAGTLYKKDVLSPIEIRQMKKGFVVILSDNKPPLVKEAVRRRHP